MPASGQSSIHFHYVKGGFHLPNRTALKEFISELIENEGVAIDAINYIFCSDAYLLKINREYLNHDTYTDIVSFQLSAPAEPLLADIYISVDRVRENAGKFQIPFVRELYRVMFHGALHLCGYKDKTVAQLREMRAKEDHYLSAYNVSRGTKS